MSTSSLATLCFQSHAPILIEKKVGQDQVHAKFIKATCPIPKRYSNRRTKLSRMAVAEFARTEFDFLALAACSLN